MKPIPNKKIKLVGFVTIFVLPIILALGAYLGRDYIEFSSKSFGTLLNPPIDIKSLNLTTLNGAPIAEEVFAKDWWLIYVAPPQCAEDGDPSS